MEAKPGRTELSRARSVHFTLDKEGTDQVTMQDACLYYYYVAVSRSDGPGNASDLFVCRNRSMIRAE